MTATAQPIAPPVDLGWGNGWKQTPQIVADCLDAQRRGERHDITDEPTQWTCCHRVTCRACGYTYQYDSGD